MCSGWRCSLWSRTLRHGDCLSSSVFKWIKVNSLVKFSKTPGKVSGPIWRLAVFRSSTLFIAVSIFYLKYSCIEGIVFIENFILLEFVAFIWAETSSRHHERLLWLSLLPQFPLLFRLILVNPVAELLEKPKRTLLWRHGSFLLRSRIMHETDLSGLVME